MSIIAKLADRSTRLVSVETEIGIVHARVRAATAGELLECSASGLVMPADPEAVRRPQPKHAGVEAVVDAMRFQSGIVRRCLLHVGDDPSRMEAVTILASEGDRPQPGTRGLMEYAVPAELAAAAFQAVLDMSKGEGWRDRAATFPGGGGGTTGLNGEAVAGAPNDAP